MGRALAAAVRRMLAVATKGPLLAAPTAWDPVPTGSTAGGSSIDLTIVVRTDLTIVARIDTVITRATLRMVAPAGLACGHPTGGAASTCAATNARPTERGTATIARTIATATIARTADLGTAAAILARPMDVVRAVTERERQMRPPSGSPAHRAGEPLPEAVLRLRITIVIVAVPPGNSLSAMAGLVPAIPMTGASPIVIPRTSPAMTNRPSRVLSCYFVPVTS